MATRRDRLLTLNDSRLSAYLAAEDESARAQELEVILTQAVTPRAREIVDSYVKTDGRSDAA